MKKMHRITSAIVLYCFLCTTAVSDLAFGQALDRGDAGDTLAAASRLDDITGQEIYDISRIRFILEHHLIAASGNGKTTSIDPNGLIETINKYSDSNKQSPVRFAKIELPSGLLCLQCRIKPGKGNIGIKTYYAVFSSTASDGGFPIEVYTEKEWKTRKVAEETKSGKVPVRKEHRTEDAAAIERGAAHQTFDILLQKAHHPLSKGFMFLVTEQKIADAHKEFSYHDIAKGIIENLKGKGVEIGSYPQNILPIEDRTFDVICKDAYSVVTQLAPHLTVALRAADGTERRITPSAHLSNNHLNLLLTRKEIVDVLLNPIAQKDRYGVLIKKITGVIVHEIGVALDCPILFFEGDRPINEIDLIYEGRASEIPPGLRKTEYVIHDLEKNAKTRDYGAGEPAGKSPADAAVNSGEKESASFTEPHYAAVLAAVLKEAVTKSPELKASYDNEYDLTRYCQQLIKDDILKKISAPDAPKAEYEITDDGPAKIEERILAGRVAMVRLNALLELVRDDNEFNLARYIDECDRVLTLLALDDFYKKDKEKLAKMIWDDITVWVDEGFIGESGVGNNVMPEAYPSRSTRKDAETVQIVFESGDEGKDQIRNKILAYSIDASRLSALKAVVGLEGEEKAPAEAILRLITKYMPSAAITASDVLESLRAHWKELGAQEPDENDESALRDVESGLNLLLNRGVLKELPSGEDDENRYMLSSASVASEEVAAIEPDVTKAAGEIAAKMTDFYTFILPEEFYKEGERERDQSHYGNIFDRRVISDENLEGFITKALKEAQDKEATSIVLIPRALINSSPQNNVITQLKRLTEVNMRFEIADLEEQNWAKYDTAKTAEEKNMARQQFRSEAYAVMFLKRYIEKDMQGTAAYRLLDFYLKTHFNLSGVTPADYINAVVNNEIAKLINVYLTFRPIERYDAAEDYHEISETLIFA